MKTLKGPALFIAQFIGDAAPFDSLETIAGWAADLGYKGLQLPNSDPRFLDLETAAESREYDYAGWAVLEWECALKHPEDGAAEGAAFIRDHIIRVTPRSFDDFASGGDGRTFNRRLLGLDPEIS